MGFNERPSGAVLSSTLEGEAAERLSARARIEKEVRKAKTGSKVGGKKAEASSA